MAEQAPKNIIPTQLWIPRPPNMTDIEYAKLIDHAKELIGWQTKKKA